MKRLLLAAALSLLTAGSAMAQTVYIVRHAEKADASADPVLSPAGEARAGALAAVMADTHPSLILVTPLQRTQLTAAPTAEYHSLTPEAVPFDGGAQGQADVIAARVAALPDDTTVLIVGHSNTVPLIVRALGFGAAADMPECEYDRMTVVTINGEIVTGDVSRYGEATVC
ncbi:SixA phosphatase family protein [Brevundimonas lenta]|uniref:Broad specificity phosphatase PhoE n=1 Tax=Brevundimonas lenta TaxID=424796 RepID=A0A7W6JE85_9CAUL|nr:phosphoglycerate mutase family protein [Brevundimonas lenta]MBB4083441.1 broad specificity phosphatase PhoE [Brevundimonas lenta]